MADGLIGGAAMIAAAGYLITQVVRAVINYRTFRYEMPAA